MARRQKKMDPDIRQKVKENIFPLSRPAVEPWDEFPWHPDGNGVCDTWKPHSSPALAIDVFGWLKVVEQRERDITMNAIAGRQGLVPGTNWQVKLEWKDPVNRLNEKVGKTQVDAIARSAESLILFECKFAEKDGGPCGQVAPLQNGQNKGEIQCNGNYEMQTNPVNKKRSRCALTGKHIRYWKVVPQVFHYSDSEVHRPCPFVGSWYQWMRNLVLAWQLMSDEHHPVRFVIVFADHPRLLFPQKLASPEWAALKNAIECPGPANLS